MTIETARQKLEQLAGNLSTVIQGKDEKIELVLLAMISGGHILIEDIPGVGKTTLARALAKSVEGTFSRVQFTPDLLPADITGINYYRPGEDRFEFKPGPIFANIILTDEINRASPRTQSALLEAMSEGQVTMDGVSHPLPDPFVVLATQNPVEYHGTFPLPEGQLDRFMLQLDLGYPPRDKEIHLMISRTAEDPARALTPVLSLEDLVSIRKHIDPVKMDPSVADYMYRIVDATRNHPGLRLGISIRGSLSWARMARARAIYHGRDYTLPEDIKRLAVPVLAHRVLPKERSDQDRALREGIISDILGQTAVPR